jgi:hypothetical protein
VPQPDVFQNHSPRMYGTEEERAHQGSDDLTAVSVARVGV